MTPATRRRRRRPAPSPAKRLSSGRSEGDDRGAHHEAEGRATAAETLDIAAIYGASGATDAVGRGVGTASSMKPSPRAR